jgi:phosphoribosylaminoimidazole-succinocarboxamide synthase
MRKRRGNPVQKLEQLYEGKAKKIFRTDEQDVFWVEYKDDATAFNGEKKGTIAGKGELNNRISAIFFTMLKEHGIKNHFIKLLSPTEQLVKKVKILPLEVVVRNIAAGSLAKRIGFAEGTILPKTVVEFYYKDDALGDPLLNPSHIEMLQLATKEQLEFLEETSLKINQILVDYLKTRNVILVDFKLEYGVTDDGEILLADEISPDTCRFWDADTKEKLDKDRFRRDLGSVEEAYQEILKRLAEDAFVTPQSAYKAKVFVTLKPSVLDPAGTATKKALETMGYGEVTDVRIGKYMEVAFDAIHREQAELRLREMCEKLLSNPVIENYRYEIEEV